MRARRLRLYGITVHTASSIEAARISLGGHNYHLVLLAAHENPEEALPSAGEFGGTIQNRESPSWSVLLSTSRLPTAKM